MYQLNTPRILAVGYSHHIVLLWSSQISASVTNCVVRLFRTYNVSVHTRPKLQLAVCADSQPRINHVEVVFNEINQMH